jgi:hypothetical protein
LMNPTISSGAWADQWAGQGESRPFPAAKGGLVVNVLFS